MFALEEVTVVLLPNLINIFQWLQLHNMSLKISYQIFSVSILRYKFTFLNESGKKRTFIQAIKTLFIEPFRIITIFNRFLI